VDFLQQVTVPVKEGAVDRGGTRDAGDADVGPVAGRFAERGDHALSAAGRVGLPSLAHLGGSRAACRVRGGGH